jgi:hypothetical protein
MAGMSTRWLLMVMAAAPLFGDQATKTALIEEMLQLTGADKTVDNVLDQQQALIKQQLSNLVLQDDSLTPFQAKLEPVIEDYQGKIIGVMKKAMRWSLVKPQMMKIYDELFSEEELSAIVAFDKTPAGRALIEKTPALTGKSMEIGMRQLADVMPEIQDLSDKMKADMRKAINRK